MLVGRNFKDWGKQKCSKKQNKKQTNKRKNKDKNTFQIARKQENYWILLIVTRLIGFN